MLHPAFSPSRKLGFTKQIRFVQCPQSQAANLLRILYYVPLSQRLHGTYLVFTLRHHMHIHVPLAASILCRTLYGTYYVVAVCGFRGDNIERFLIITLTSFWLYCALLYCVDTLGYLEIVSVYRNPHIQPSPYVPCRRCHILMYLSHPIPSLSYQNCLTYIPSLSSTSSLTAHPFNYSSPSSFQPESFL